MEGALREYNKNYRVYECRPQLDDFNNSIGSIGVHGKFFTREVIKNFVYYIQNQIYYIRTLKILRGGLNELLGFTTKFSAFFEGEGS